MSVSRMTGERTTSQALSRFEDEDMWAFVPAAPEPVTRSNVPLCALQPSLSVSKLKVWLA